MRTKPAPVNFRLIDMLSICTVIRCVNIDEVPCAVFGFVIVQETARTYVVLDASRSLVG